MRYMKYLIPVIIIVMLPEMVFAADSGGAIGRLHDLIYNQVGVWEKRILQAAQALFIILATIDLVYTFFEKVFNPEELTSLFGLIIRKFLFYGFFLWVLLSAPNIADRVFNSFIQLGTEVQVQELRSGTPGDMMAETVILAQKLVAMPEVPEDPAWYDMADVAVKAIKATLMGPFALMIIIMGALMCAVLLMIQIEFYFVAYAGMLTLGFGSTRWTYQYSVNYLKALFATGLKYLFTIMMVGLVFSILHGFANDIVKNTPNDPPTFSDIMAFAGVMLVGTFLVIRAPGMAGAVLSGLGGGSDAGSAVAGKAMAIGNAATMGAGMAVASGVQGVGAGQAAAAAWKEAGAQQQASLGDSMGQDQDLGGPASVSFAESQGKDQDISGGGGVGGATGASGRGGESGSDGATGASMGYSGADGSTSSSATGSSTSSASGGQSGVVDTTQATSESTSGAEKTGLGASLMGNMQRAGMAAGLLGAAAKAEIGQELRGTAVRGGTLGGHLANHIDAMGAEREASEATGFGSGISSPLGAGGISASMQPVSDQDAVNSGPQEGMGGQAFTGGISGTSSGRDSDGDGVSDAMDPDVNKQGNAGSGQQQFESPFK